MSKDFRAKQVRTNKIIGRGKPAISGHASELQLVLMKSGSANFAGGVTDPVAHDAQAGWLAANHDTGRLSREIGRVGSDVWLLVDGGQTHRNQRSTGESVLFLGDVVVSGTLYAERQRINITTQSVIANEDHTLMLSGSVFVNENQGISVGKTAIINKDSYTEPRSGNITTTDSVFWAGDGEGSGSGAGPAEKCLSKVKQTSASR